MPRTVSTSQIDAIAREVIVDKKPADNIFRADPLLIKLMEKALIKVEGGNEIKQNLMFAKSGLAGSFAPKSSFSTNPTDIFIESRVVWAHYKATCVIFENDILEANGDPMKLLNIVEESVNNSILSLKDAISTDLYHNGATANKIDGLDNICSTTLTLSGLDPATYAWWVPANVNSTQTTFTETSLRNSDSLIVLEGAPVEYRVTHRVVFNKIKDYFAGTKKAVETDPELTRYNIPSIMFEAAPIAFDSHCAAGYLYGMNLSKGLKFVQHNQTNLEDFEPFEKLAHHGLWAQISNVFFKCNIVCKQRRLFYTFTALPSS